MTGARATSVPWVGVGCRDWQGRSKQAKRGLGGLRAAWLRFVCCPPASVLSDVIALPLLAELADSGVSITHFSLG